MTEELKRPQVLVLLAGCGNKDGSEIHESVLTLLCLSQAGADYQCAAPNINQAEVLNFLDDTNLAQERNVLQEAARIARSDIKDLNTLSIDDYDALMIPGGTGVAKNLCTFATEGPECSVLPEIEKLITDAHSKKKPIGAICIAPALVAKVLASKTDNLKLTLGTAEGPTQALTTMGATAKTCFSADFIFDKDNRVVSTPAYMHGDASPADLYQGIAGCVRAVLELSVYPVAG